MRSSLQAVGADVGEETLGWDAGDGEDSRESSTVFFLLNLTQILSVGF